MIKEKSISQKISPEDVDVSFINDADVPAEGVFNVAGSYGFIGDDKDGQQEAVLDALAYNEKTFKLKKQKDEHEWRAIYLGRSFYLVGFVIYNAFLFLLFSAVGLFNVSDSVMIALLTTAAANVIGILAVAFKWLYNNKI